MSQLPRRQLGWNLDVLLCLVKLLSEVVLRISSTRGVGANSLNRGAQRVHRRVVAECCKFSRALVVELIQVRLERLLPAFNHIKNLNEAFEDIG